MQRPNVENWNIFTLVCFPLHKHTHTYNMAYTQIENIIHHSKPQFSRSHYRGQLLIAKPGTLRK